MKLILNKKEELDINRIDFIESFRPVKYYEDIGDQGNDNTRTPYLDFVGSTENLLEDNVALDAVLLEAYKTIIGMFGPLFEKIKGFFQKDSDGNFLLDTDLNKIPAGELTSMSIEYLKNAVYDLADYFILTDITKVLEAPEFSYSNGGQSFSATLRGASDMNSLFKMLPSSTKQLIINSGMFMIMEKELGIAVNPSEFVRWQEYKTGTIPNSSIIVAGKTGQDVDEILFNKIDNVTGGITTNEENIKTNTENIETNKENIQQNTDNITDNTEKITDNTEKITDNTEKINDNVELIETNKDDIKDLNDNKINSFNNAIRLDSNTHKKEGDYIMVISFYNKKLLTDSKWGPEGINENFKNIETNKGKIKDLDDNKINSFEGSIILHPSTHKKEDGKIINSDIYNKQLLTNNKWGKGAINEVYVIADKNIKGIEENVQKNIRQGNLIELLFEIIESKTEAYVKSSTIKGTYYQPKFISTEKEENEVSDPSIIDQISNTEHKIFSGFSATLGVTAVIVIKESSVGDVEFTLLKDGVKVSDVITKTLTGKKMELGLVFKKYPIADDGKDHIYMISTRGITKDKNVKQPWYNISYLGLEFTILGAGGGTGGGDVTLSYVNSENDRQDDEYQLKLNDKFNRFTDSDNGKSSIIFDPNSTAVNGSGQVYMTEIWNPKIEGKNVVNFVLETRKIVDDDRVRIDYTGTYGKGKIIIKKYKNVSLIITEISKGNLGYTKEQTSHYTTNKIIYFSKTINVINNDNEEKGSVLSRWGYHGRTFFEINYDIGQLFNSSVIYGGRYNENEDLATKERVTTISFLIKKELNKLKGINQTDNEIVNEVLDEIENKEEIGKIGKLFAKHIKLRKEKENATN